MRLLWDKMFSPLLSLERTPIIPVVLEVLSLPQSLPGQSWEGASAFLARRESLASGQLQLGEARGWRGRRCMKCAELKLEKLASQKGGGLPRGCWSC